MFYWITRGWVILKAIGKELTNVFSESSPPFRVCPCTGNNYVPVVFCHRLFSGWCSLQVILLLFGDFNPSAFTLLNRQPCVPASKAMAAPVIVYCKVVFTFALRTARMLYEVSYTNPSSSVPTIYLSRKSSAKSFFSG